MADLELSGKTFAVILFITFALAIAVSVLLSNVVSFSNKDISCNCPQQNCVCPNLTIPDSLCSSIQNPSPIFNMTYNITAPDCVLSGCNKTDVITSCLAKNMDLKLKLTDSNNTVLQNNIMSYYGNGIYKQTYQNITFEIIVGGS